MDKHQMLAAASALDADKKLWQDANFKRWLDMPTTKIVISLIPEAAHHEAFHMLLRAAYDTGWHGGESYILGSFLENVIKRQEPK